MAPLPSPHHMSSLSKRNFEMETWRIILGAIGAFLLLGLVGILAAMWRHHLIKKRERLQAAAQESRGNYAKIEDGRYSLDDLETPNGFRVLQLQRTVSTSSDSSRSSSKASTRETEQQSRQSRQLRDSVNHSRSQSLSVLPVAAPRGRSNTPYVDAKGRSCSARPSIDSYEFSNMAHSIVAPIPMPPRAAFVEQDMLFYNTRETSVRSTDTRSSSPAPSVLSRSISMLRPRSASLSR